MLNEANINSKLAVILEEKLFKLEGMVIQEELNAISTISRLDIQMSPVNSSQEILRKVPGLIIGQHAGGGKAEQLFLQQEFVYVGDAGILEPSSKTERYGLDLGLRYQFND